LKFVELPDDEIDTEDWIGMNKLIDQEAERMFFETFRLDGKVHGLEMELMGRRIRCCVAKK